MNRKAKIKFITELIERIENFIDSDYEVTFEGDDVIQFIFEDSMIFVEHNANTRTILVDQPEFESLADWDEDTIRQFFIQNFKIFKLYPIEDLINK